MQKYYTGVELKYVRKCWESAKKELGIYWENNEKDWEGAKNLLRNIWYSAEKMMRKCWEIKFTQSWGNAKEE